MGNDQFENKWRRVLADVPDYEEYAEEACDKGWDNLPTCELPYEAQEDIDKYRRSISTKDILVVNHGLSSWLHFDGTYSDGKDQAEIEYLTNLKRLLAETDSARIQIVAYDYPEHYVLDSRRRLVNGDITSVILTPFDAGKALNSKRAYQEIGEGKRVYLTGSYLACLASTAEELWRNDNKVVVIEDAVTNGSEEIDADPTLRKASFVEEIEIDDLTFISTEEFLQQYGRK